jgi:hypothetical protein
VLVGSGGEGHGRVKGAITRNSKHDLLCGLILDQKEERVKLNESIVIGVNFI